MPEQFSLKINDIFWSFQGEGIRVGIPSIFVRLCGCTLGCDYCDTKEAWTEGSVFKIDHILNTIKGLSRSYPASQIVFTGGEPYEQNLGPLVSACREAGFYLAIETSGSKYENLPLDWVTVSPKDVNNYHLDSGFLGNINEMKLIVNQHLTIEVLKNMRSLGENFPIFLQPNCFDKFAYQKTWDLFYQCQQLPIDGVRIGFQLHKIYKVK